MPTTPDEWLPVLTKRLDAERPRIAKLRDYNGGHAPLPEMGENLRASWQAFQRKARTDYGGLARRSLANRIRQNGLLVGEDPNSAQSLAAHRIWRDNRMAQQLGNFLTDYLDTGVGYLVDGQDSGGAVITAEMPEYFYAAVDPLRPWRTRAAIKVWRDEDAHQDYALVWVPGERQRYSRDSFDDNRSLIRSSEGGWAHLGAPETYDGSVPVFVARRASGKRCDDTYGPLGFVEPHLDVIDRINLGKLNRLVVVAMQAFRQRALTTKDGSEGIPEKDENDNPIDYEKLFSPAPGALWDLPPGVEIWESQTADWRQLLEGEKEDARSFAGVTGTPISVFIPDGQNQSAQGAANATAEQVAQAENEIARVAPVLAAAMVRALEIESVPLDGQSVEVSFEPPAYVSMSEKFAAVQQAKAGGLATTTIMREVLGWSPERVAQAQADLAQEQLAAATLTAAVTGGNAVA